MTEQIAPDLVWLIQRDLNINQEVSLLRSQNAERKEKLKQLVQSESVGDKIGLTRMPFSPKKTPTEALRDKINDVTNEIREKVQEWQDIKSQVEKQIEGQLLRTDDQFIRVCRAFGCLGESNAIMVNLRNKLMDYRPRLGQIRGAMAAGYNSATQQFSYMALETIKGAVQSGYGVDGAVLKMQERESQFYKLVENSFAEHVKFPECYPLNLGDFSEALRTMPLESGLEAVGKGVQQCEELFSRTLPGYENTLKEAEDAIRKACLTRVEQYWQNLRAEVWQNMQKIQPMPQSNRMNSRAPFSTNAQADESTQREINQAEVALNAKSTEPVSTDPDKGKGLSNDYFNKPDERRSRLKLRVPN